MEIRQIHESDLPAVHALGIKVFGSIAHSSLVIRQLFDLHRRHTFVCCDSNITGYCIGGIESGASVGHIVSLAVDPDCRRQKLGYLLTERFIQAFKQDLVREIKLVVAPENLGAIALYSKLGFEKGLISKDYFGVGADRLIMQLFQKC